ncbi:MAG: Wzy polymerase domain-containing protein [Victivallaceae bacterium]
MRNVVAWMIVIVTILLPLKFGTLAALPEVPAFYPGDWFSWLIITWPPVSFPFFSGGLLLLALAVFPVRIEDFRTAFAVTMMWLVVAFVSIIGAINATNMDYVIVYLVDIFGFVSFGASMYLMLSTLPEFKRVVLWSIFIGAVLTTLLGIEQISVGFDDTRKFVETQEQQYGGSMNSDLKSRVWDNRVFATFGSCNSLAGYMLMVMPLCLFLCWQFCGGFKLRKSFKVIAVALLALLMGVVFFATLSRGAYLSLILACVIFIMVFPVRKSVRIALFVLMPVVIITGALYIAYAGRGFYSMLVRFDYICTSFQMFLNHPWLGTGWGDFFYDHMLLKQTLSKEAPHTAHNILMDFLSQTGIVGFSACLAAILYPLFKIAKKIYSAPRQSIFTSLDSYVIFGLIAFFIHSLMDVNLQIPASMAMALVLMVAMTIPDDKQKVSKKDHKSGSGKLSALLATILMFISGGVSAYGGFHLLRADYAYSRLSDLCSYWGKSKEQYLSISPEEVKRELENCVSLKPYSPFPWTMAANFMQSRGCLELAEEFYTKARELSPQGAFIYYRLFLLQRAQGKEDEAQKNLEKARKLFPNNEDYRDEKTMMPPPSRPMFGPLKN